MEDDSVDKDDCDDEDEASIGEDILRRKYESPAQLKCQEEISKINERLANLNEARNLGIGEENQANLTKQIRTHQDKKKSLEAKLKNLKARSKASKKFRDKKKEVLKQAIRDYPALQSSVRVRDTEGRPPLEETYPNLHEDILNIATIGAAASDRRREDLFRSVKTLSDLQKALEDMGYQLSRSALYTRLLPKAENSAEGKRHVRTVPVR